jgi:hypothetical protein
LIRAGEAAALAALPTIQQWLPRYPQTPDGLTPGSKPASPSRSAPQSSFAEATAHR